MRILLFVSALALPPRQPAHEIPDTSAAARASAPSAIVVGILDDLAAAFDDVGRRHGYDYQAKVEGWLEPSYVASARKRRDIAEYFLAKQAYAQDLNAHMDSILNVVVERRIDESGMTPDQQEEMRAAFFRGFEKANEKHHLMIRAIERQARVALAMHDFLVRIDARVAVNRKTKALVFARETEHRRYVELSLAIDAANELLAEAGAR
ncbi:MAG TPA: hypothetical protein VHM30_20650 [Gemmatimonadaceae bacterium]|nr:hypothetical protein [Gemmatimonadaceae bacterium]